jgi:glycosyltransferase involved in cell wall biosynthesis
VWFRGTLDRPAVFEALAHCDVLLHPSFHDSGGYVCAEAMAAGRPMICLDLGGPAMLITSESGVRVPVRTPEQIVADLTTAAATLATNRALLHRLGTGARLRVQQACSWEYRGELLDQLYRSIVTPHEDAVALAAIEC